MRLVTPGDALVAQSILTVLSIRVTDSATETIPPVKRAGDSWQENLRDIFLRSLLR